jgi:hypothetical protein
LRPDEAANHFTIDRIFKALWSRDGKPLALVRGNVTSDTILITDFK